MPKQSQILAFSTALLVALSSPAAALAATYTVTSTDDDGVGTLRATVGSTVDGDIVELPSSGTAYSVTSGPININTSISIQGAGQASTTIDGGGTSQILRVAANKTVSISGVTMQNGNDWSDGGAIHNAGNTSISDSTLKDNTAPSGGAISNTGNLTLSNVVLSGNTAQVGGAIVTNLFNDPGDNSVTVLSSAFNENSATNVGGAIYSAGSNLDIQNTSFFANSTSGSGGAVFAAGINAGNDTQVTISGSTFTTNLAGNWGGAVTTSGAQLAISDSVFDDNASPFGGAIGAGIYSDLGDTTVTLTNTTLSNNAANNNGGAVFNSGTTITATGSEITGNFASLGGGLYSTGILNLIDTILDQNTSGPGGGLYVTYHDVPGDVTVLIDGGSVSDNQSHNAGGGIYGEGVHVSIQGATFDGNYAASNNGSVGGAIYLQYGSDYGDTTLDVADSTFSNNTVQGQFGNGGGAFYINAPLTVAGSTFTGNSNTPIYVRGDATITNTSFTENDGGINQDYLLTPGDVSFSMQDSNISHNDGVYSNGALYLSGSNVSISNSVFDYNTGSYGAGLFLYCQDPDLDATLTNVNVRYNASDGNTAGINTDCDTTIQDSLIIGNTSATDGGGIYAYGSLAVSGSTINNNTALGSHGGGIYAYAYTPGAVTIVDSIIDNNTATWGGGIYNEQNNLSITNTSVSNNISESGGGIYNYRAPLTVTGSTIDGNAANFDGSGSFQDKAQGGGIWQTGGILSIIASSISGNSVDNTSSSATALGGAIYASIYSDYDTTITIQGSALDYNSISTTADSAGVSGGVIEGYGVAISIQGSSLSHNSQTATGANYASVQGGVIDTSSWSTPDDVALTITNSVFNDNTAYAESTSAGQIWGGVISNLGAAATITGTTFDANTATMLASDDSALFGGVILSWGILDLLDSSLSNNVSQASASSFPSRGVVLNYSPTQNGGAATITNSNINANVLTFAGSGETQGTVYTNGTMTVSGSHIDNNDLSGAGDTANGGGIYAYSSQPYTVTVEDSSISGNLVTSQGQGGAIFNSGLNLLVSGSTLRNNAAGTGGAIYSDMDVDGDDVALTGSTVSDNSSSTHGGGIAMIDGQLNLLTSTVADNTAGGKGGGVYAAGLFGIGADVVVTQSTISGNTAQQGGGLYTHGDWSLMSSTLANNTASVEGGGILVSGVGGSIESSTIAGNTAPDFEGGGIGNSISAGLHNSIVANNTGGDCDSGLSSDNGYNIDSDGTCVYEPTSQTGDPKLGPLQDNGGPTKTMAISPTSIAFNTADPNDCQATDQRGETRPALGGCDIGAYEAQPTPPPPTPPTPTPATPAGNTEAQAASEEASAPVTLAAVTTQEPTKPAKKTAAKTALKKDGNSGYGEGETARQHDSSFVHKVVTFLTEPLTVTFSALLLGFLLLLLLGRRHGKSA